MNEDREEKKAIEDSLKVCREIQEYLKRERKEYGPVKVGMNPGTRSEIDKILKSLEKTAAEPVRPPHDQEPSGGQGTPLVSGTEFVSEPKVVSEGKVVSEPKTVSEAEVVSEPEPVSAPEPGPVMPETATETMEPVTMEPEPAAPEKEKNPGVKPIPVIKVETLDLEPVEEADQEETKAEYNERHPFLRACLRILICVAVALLLAFLITKFVAHHTSVEGSSMETTLANGDQLIVENLTYYFHDPERFDVIVFPHGENVNYIKRIIGLPGETVQIRNGDVYINGEMLDENYGRESIEDAGLASQEIVLGEEEYFVLGDNRNASVDSRKEEVGTVSRSEIKGRAWFRFYPMDRASLVE